jgi:threonine dehydrogenase-like Zn-dependent dehydrogenase
MKAVVFHKPRSLAFEDVATPSYGPDQVGLRVLYAGFCGSDHSIIEYDFAPEGTILGHEMSAVVEAVGAEVEGIAVGQRCVIRPTYCGSCKYCQAGRTHLCLKRVHVGKGELGGSFAERMVAYPQMIIPIPDAVDSRSGAMAEPYASALHGIRVTGVETGSALVIGGGPVGLATVDLLSALGYWPIVLSEPVAAKRELGLTLGATMAVDPRETDLVASREELSGDDGFGIVFECSGASSVLQTGIECLNRAGALSFVAAVPTPVAFQPISVLMGVERSIFGVGSSDQAECREVLELMAQGKLNPLAAVSDEIALAELPSFYRDRIDQKTVTKVLIAVNP